MANWFFDAPAFMKDFKNPQDWHDAMAKEATGIIRDLVASVLNKAPDDVTPTEIQAIGPTLAYVDPVASAPPEAATTIPISPWGAFPRAVERKAPWPLPHDPDDILGNYRAVEHQGDEDHRPGIFKDFDGQSLTLPVRDRQDEYLEWIARSKEGKITKAVFVAEGYDYYDTLFKHDENLVVQMYKDFTEVNHITADDLRAKRGVVRHLSNGQKYTVVEVGEFNPRNTFNINPGIVHLSHRANSLGAEVNLAGVSGIARMGVDGKTLQAGNPELLLCCSQGGNPNRNSDPLIGDQAYSQVLQKFRYTLANPVGLYVASIEEQRLTLPDGTSAPRDWWRVIRGNDLWDPSKSRVLRIELEVPQSQGIVLGDLFVDGNPIKYSGQLAQLISVHLYVTRWTRTDGSIGPVINCNTTCCRKIGTQELVLSDGKCDPGYELAFSGLIPSPNDQFSITTKAIHLQCDEEGFKSSRNRL